MVAECTDHWATWAGLTMQSLNPPPQKVKNKNWAEPSLAQSAQNEVSSNAMDLVFHANLLLIPVI